MLGLGFPELGVNLVVRLVTFGPGKLPQMGEALARESVIFSGRSRHRQRPMSLPHRPRDRTPRSWRRAKGVSV